VVVLVQVDRALVDPAVLADLHGLAVRPVRADQQDPARPRHVAARPVARQAAGADDSYSSERKRVVELRAQRQKFLVAALRMYPVGQQHGVAVPFPVNPE